MRLTIPGENETGEVGVFTDTDTGEIVLCPLIETDDWERGIDVKVRLSFDEAVQVAEKLNKIIDEKRRGATS